MQYLKFCTLVALVLATSACGFKLRNDFQLAPAYQSMVVTSVERHSKLEKALSKRLQLLGVEVFAPSSQEATTLTSNGVPIARITLLPERLDRRLLSLFPTGQVAEYELIYTCRYQLVDGDAEVREMQFELFREYQDDPDQVLAKSRELDLILDELRQEAADRIIRQFSVDQIR